jgi:hypothetical protein
MQVQHTIIEFFNKVSDIEERMNSNSILILGSIILVFMLIYINQLKCHPIKTTPPTEGYYGGVENKPEEPYYAGEMIPNYEFAADAASSNPGAAASFEPEYAGTYGNVFNSMPGIGSY